MGAWNMVTGSGAAAATGTIGVAHGIDFAGASPTDAIVMLGQRTTNVVTATLAPNATNFFISRTETTSWSVEALIGVGIRSGQY